MLCLTSNNGILEWFKIEMCQVLVNVRIFPNGIFNREFRKRVLIIENSKGTYNREGFLYLSRIVFRLRGTL